jgi:hypothetical protein
MNIVGILIGALVLSGIVYALVSPNSLINQRMKSTPFYMKAIGVIVFLLGVTIAALAGFGVIGLGGTGNADWIIPVASLGLGSVFGLLFCVNFYSGHK